MKKAKNKSYNIILVEDHIVLGDALGRLINSFQEFSVIATANNGKDFIDKITDGLTPDLILLDLNMPVMDGYQTAEWLQQNRPEIKIVVLTMYGTEIPLIRLLQTGVRGFLKKDIHPAELHTALLAIAEDGYYYSHATTGKLANIFQKTYKAHSPFEKGSITEMEITFLKLAATDMTYKEIASKLKISPSTVDNYREALFDKLEIKSRVGLAIYAIKNGIITI
jgi:DNA-binding NarL/FixJ family response regulator